MSRPVLSLNAEYAVRSCHLAVSRIQLGQPVGARRIPRLDDERLPGGASYAVVQIVSITELFDCELFRAYVNEAIASQHPAAQALWQKDADQAEKKWDTRSERWNKWFSVAVQTAEQYKAFRPFIEVRNAVAHGLGSLTRLQLGKDGSASETRKSLHSVGVTVEGTRLLLSQQTADACAVAAISYVRWLDAETMALPRPSPP